MASGEYVIPFKDKLKCGICKSTISDARSISCGHTFCMDCLNRSASPHGTVECRECKTKSKLPSGGADNLPRCFVINGFLDTINETFGQGNGTDKEKGGVTIRKHGFQLEENFSCAICLTLMTDPRYLPCGHSFCLGCLMALRQSQERQGIKCSHCKVEHALPPHQGVHELPVGHRIKRIATEIKSNKGETSEPSVDRPKRSLGSRRQPEHHGPRRSPVASPRDRMDDVGDEKRRAQAEYQIFLRKLNGKTVALDINPNANIGDLENKVRESTGVDPTQFGLTCNGRNLERGRSLRYYNITNHSVVNMTAQMAGGSV